MSDTAAAEESEVPPDSTRTHRIPMRRGLSSRRGDPRERLVLGCVLLSAVALEILPLAAVLLVLSGTQGPLPALPLPIWWMSAVVLLGWGVAALHGGQPGKSAGSHRRKIVMKALVLLSGGLSLFLSFVLAGVGELGLVLLAGYLWWRGLLLGRDRLTQDHLYRRFVAGFVALVLALAIVGTLNGPARSSLEGILALLLPFQMFVGLAAVVLAHRCDTVREYRERLQRAAVGQPSATFRLSWVRTAAGISAMVVLPALLLALAVSFDAVQRLGALLGWLVQELLGALFFVLGPLFSLLSSHAQNSPCQNQTPPQSPSCPQFTPQQFGWQGTLPSIAPDVAAWVGVALALLVLALVVQRLLRRFGGLARSSEFDEERERLNGGEVLRRQVRALLTKWRARPASDMDQDGPAAGSVRYRYREVLRVAQSVGRGRDGSETPDEYAQRMPTAHQEGVASTIGGQGVESLEGALATLTEAYDTARYRDPQARAQAPAKVVAAQQTILRWLAAHGQYRKNGSASHGSLHRQ